MILNSNYNLPNNELPIIPFKLDNKTLNEPSEFEIKVLINDVRYVYGFKADKKTIYEEYLYYYPNGRPVKIFIRNNTSEYSFNASDERVLNDIKEKNTANKFFLATATNWNFSKTKPVFDFFTQNIDIVLTNNQIKTNSFKKYLNDPNKELEHFALKVLKKADFNIDGYEINEEQISKDSLTSLPLSIQNYFLDKFYQVSTKHIIDNSEFSLDINEESLGTQVVFSLIPILKEVLDNGKILFVDEFDRSLHPFLVKYFVEIFNDTDINKKGAQFIFNTHDTNLLDTELLRRDQIWFTEKNNEDASSVLYPLDDFSVRKTENIEKGYLLGRYGAIPFMENNISI